MASAGRVKEELWKLCFPEVAFDPDCVLPSVYEAALLRKARETKVLLTNLLSVDAVVTPG